MAYTITVVQDVEVTLTEAGSYGIVAREYIPAAAYDELGHLACKEYRKIDGNQYVKESYGYLPPVEAIKSVTKEIFKQTVESLDVAAVITAINNL